ncbi:IS701 family transposase [Mangrovihabitans endophyticus]|uniref:Putative ISXo8 transposase n=1 Tax=Mangrovihabitans endophyticus TaxID=1751298 RepID=A0A8J3BSG8_9ACTN|nr:transposase [Mangrovihabitans endophyticus]GGK74085.1 putative ISXo8 transposase [Mangrovihabitans endophyticus]
MVWEVVQDLDGLYAPFDRARPAEIKPRTGRPVGEVLDEVCDRLFASLARRDQRLRARDYLRGLLAAPGRKTIRNVAAFVGGSGVDQRLHHFISDSSWNWDEVRRALARHVTEAAPPDAWVVTPVMIPKAGLHAVGVSRCFCRIRRRTLHAQRAVGVMASAAGATFPVSWRLQMPREWLDDQARRARSALPDELSAETLSECTAHALQGVLNSAPDRLPVVVDGRDLEYAQLQLITAAEGPMLLRIPPNIPLRVSDAGLVGHRPEVALPARQIAEAARSRRRLHTYASATGAVRRQMVSSVDVLPAVLPQRLHSRLRLVAVSPFTEHADEELWLTNQTSLPIGAVLDLAGRLALADHDLDLIAERRGIWDFSGRSYPGWHRHVTLASAAHAVQTLAGDETGRLGRVAA